MNITIVVLIVSLVNIANANIGSAAQKSFNFINITPQTHNTENCKSHQQKAIDYATFSTSDYVSISGTTNVLQSENGSIEYKSNLNLTKASSSTCPNLSDLDNLTQTELITALTHPCRYDRLERPIPKNVEDSNIETLPVNVYTRVYIYVMQNFDSSDFQFNIYGLLQLRYVDIRLAFGQYAPNRQQPIIGEAFVRDLIWVPHIFLTNEHDSTVLGTSEKDILTSIAADGTVIVSTRIRANLYCWMNLVKFPFDEQFCSTIMQSWMYNSSQLQLHWEHESPISFDQNVYLTEFELNNFWCNESLNAANQTDLWIGAAAGNFSSLSFTVHLTRTVGFYMMDYFLPSMMIVAISWVSFWLQADQTPARTTLGATTMLSFITLHSSQGKNLPKVSYIKVSEVWFLVCTVFIVGSLVEFAFVNSIWRRKKNVQLKKVNTKYIFKSTLTPNIKRKDLENGKIEPNIKDNSNATCEAPKIVIETESGSQNIANNISINAGSVCIRNKTRTNKEKDKSQKASWATMTPKEVALWIDRKSRFAFPLAFIFFNALFWTFVYCL